MYLKGHYLGTRCVFEVSPPGVNGEYLKDHYLGTWCVFEGSLPVVHGVYLKGHSDQQGSYV